MMQAYPALAERITAVDYFAMPETMLPNELIEGEFIMSPAPMANHQFVIARLFALLSAHIPHGTVVISPIDVQLNERTVVQPDVAWLAKGGQCRLVDGRLQGAPALIVEVLSPGSVRHDRKTKFALYEQHGVSEYWIVDVFEACVEVYRLHDGRYQRQGVYTDGDSFFCAALGTDLALANIFTVPDF